MKPLQDVLDKISWLVSSYEDGEFLLQDKLLDAQRSLSSNIYWLTTHYIEYKNLWNKVIYNRQEENGKRESKASAENRADELYPEVEMCKRLLEASKGVSISINYELQLMKD